LTNNWHKKIKSRTFKVLSMINKSRYNSIFINLFKVSSIQFENEYQRVINIHGDSEEIVIQFYLEAFKTLISQIKKELVHDVQYDSIISNLYKQFIDALKQDNLDSAIIQNEFDEFKKGIAKNVSNIATKTKNDSYKSYNLNTKYGRRKAREQAWRNYSQLSPEKKSKYNLAMTIILILICLIVWFLVGTNNFLKWLSH